MKYVDGFVMVVPAKKLVAYKRLAAGAGKIWMKHGALAYAECVGDDMKTHCGLPFPRLAKLCDPNDLPFDMKRMSHGGFRTLVDL